MTAPCRYQLLANSRVYLSLWKNDNIFFAWLRHIAASCISFATTFLQKSPARSFSCVSFCEKGHAPPLVLVCKRALADETCFQPFEAQDFICSNMQSHLFQSYRISSNSSSVTRISHPMIFICIQKRISVSLVLLFLICSTICSYGNKTAAYMRHFLARYIIIYSSQS